MPLYRPLLFLLLLLSGCTETDISGASLIQDPGDTDEVSEGATTQLDTEQATILSEAEKNDTAAPSGEKTEEIEPHCETSEDCNFLPLKPCQDAYCNMETGRCERTNKAPTTPCKPGDLCHEPGFCDKGECISPPIICPDSTSCTLWKCRPSMGCAPQFIEGSCTPDDPCALSGNCAQGECTPETYLPCDDGNLCTLDTCDKDTGGCLFTPTEQSCDDGSPCTTGDTCTDVGCLGSGVNCDDLDSCTADSCDPESGECIHKRIEDQPCDDENPCTVEDICTASTCGGTPMECDDGNPCNGMEICQVGLCVAREIPSCGDGIIAEACGEVCDDGNATDGDGCSAQCQYEPVECQTAADCGPETSCSIALCDPETKLCAWMAVEGTCDDGDPCSVDDICSNGACISTILICDDELTCTTDACIDGECVHTPDDTLCPDEESSCLITQCSNEQGCTSNPLPGTDCNDDNACTLNDICTESGTCEGEWTDCPAIPCHDVFCDPSSGCDSAPSSALPCDDGDPCTAVDACDKGVCSGKAILGGPDCEIDDGEYCSGPAEANALWECNIAIASETASDIVASGLQFTLSYDPKEIAFQAMKDLVCFDGAGCFDVEVTGLNGFPLSSGHQVSMAPMDASGWDIQPCDENGQCVKGECEEGLCTGSGGFGGFIIVHLALPDTPLNDAFFDNEGDLQGDPVIARVVFMNKLNLAAAPKVQIGEAVAVGTDGANLFVVPTKELLVSKP